MILCHKFVIIPLSEIIVLCWFYILKHGTLIRAGITCKKISCYMRDSACKWLILENAQIFRSYAKHF